MSQKKLIDWNHQALIRKARNSKKQGKLEESRYYEDLAYVYDLGLVNLTWIHGIPKLKINF